MVLAKATFDSADPIEQTCMAIQKFQLQEFTVRNPLYINKGNAYSSSSTNG